jgi:hypothetical protein
MHKISLKRVVSFILSVLFVFVITTASAFADEETIYVPYFYYTLTEDEQTAYVELKSAIMENIEIVNLPVKLEDASAQRVTALALYYDPETFNIGTIKASNEGTKTVILLTYKMDAEDFAKANEDIKAKVDEILAVALEKESTYSKMKSIHDGITAICRYTSNHKDRLSMYGALIVGRADSFGYAKAFTYIAEKAGITSFVNITSMGDKTYARSTVYYSERWYNIDCSKDDALTRYKENENYAYFLVPDSFFAGHKPYNTYFKSPACIDGTRYFYRAVNLDARTDSGARTIITDLIESAAEQKMNTIRLSFYDDAALESFIKTVTTTDFLPSVLTLASKNIEHKIITDFADVAVNKSTRVVTIVFFYPDSKLSDYYVSTLDFSEEQLAFFKSKGIK